MKQPEEESRRVMLFYESFEEAINDIFTLGDIDTAAKLYRAIIRYGLYGEMPELNGITATMWKLIYPNLKSGRDKAAAGREGGKKGGKASKLNNPNGRRGKASATTDTDTAQPSDGSPICDDEAPKPKPKATPARFSPPSVDEVQQYITMQGHAVNAANFVDFYAAKGWKIGNNPMKDWRAAVRTWQRREQERPTTSTAIRGTLGAGEYVNPKGQRTYGNSGVIVPQDAPPRPSEAFYWGETSQMWERMI